MRRRLGVLVVTVACGVALPVAAAEAKVYCVGLADTTGCTDVVTAGVTPGERLSTALASSHANAGPDTVRFGPGTYERPGVVAFSVNGSAAKITMTGPGSALATLRTPDPTAAFTVSADGNTEMSGFRVEAPDRQSGTGTGVYLAGSGPSSLDDVAVIDVTPLVGGEVRAIEIPSPNATLNDVRTSGATIGVFGRGSGGLVITDSDVEARSEALSLSSEIGSATVSGTRLAGTGDSSAVAALRFSVGTVTLRGVDLSGKVGIAQGCPSAGGTSTLDADRVTAVGQYPTGAIGMFCSVAGSTATADVRNSLVKGLVHVSRSGSAATSLTLSRSRYDGPASVTVQAGATFTPSELVTTAPMFAAGSNRLTAGSPLVDALPAATTTETGIFRDPDGGFLRRDANGDGAASADYGAYEIQPTAVPLPAGNLLAVPGAEAAGAATSALADPVLPAPWVRTAGNMTFARYGSSFFPRTFLAALLGAGDNVFIGGSDSPQPIAKAEQVVDLGASARGIDTGQGTFALAALLGGYADEADRATVTATFRGVGGASLGSVSIGPVTQAQRDVSTSLLPRSTAGAIPVGTRSVVVELAAERIGSDLYNDATFDNVALTANVPTVADPPGPTPPIATPPGTGPPVIAPPVFAPPVFAGVKLKGGRYRLDSKGRLRLPVVCPATARTACTGTLKLTTRITRRVGGKSRTRTVTLASGKVALAPGKSVTARLTIGTVKRRLVKKPGLKGTLTSSTRDGASPTLRRTTASITVLRATRRATFRLLPANAARRSTPSSVNTPSTS